MAGIDNFTGFKPDKDAWLRACQTAPYQSEAVPPFYEGDVCWPEGYPKDDTSRLLVWANGEWVSLSAAWGRVFEVQK